jgi:dTDP-4-amino-4,6-dideoxygalactose transaminase
MAAILTEVGPGDEVVLPSFTFVSTANAFCLRGAKPIFVDIDPKTMNISVDGINNAITKNTKVIVPVHYAGVPCDMDAIMEIGKKHGAFIVEDAAQALGSFYKGKALGTIGDFGTLSFHETKNVISGEGGALLINNSSFIERAEIIREKGTNRTKFFRGQVDKYTWVDLGSSFLPSELISAFLCAQLEQVDSINGKRIELYNNYLKLLQPLALKYGFSLPEIDSHNGHMFYLLAHDLIERDSIIKYLKGNDIQSVFHYVPLHSSPMGIKYGYKNGDFPITENISERLLRLPMYYELSLKDQERIAQFIENYYEKGRPS